MTVITGPVIPEKKSVVLSRADGSDKINETLSVLHPDGESEATLPETAPQAEQKEREIPCFTAPAPVRRRRLPYFGTVLAQVAIAIIIGGAVWLGLNFGGETIGSAVRSVLIFLLNG